MSSIDSTSSSPGSVQFAEGTTFGPFDENDFLTVQDLSNPKNGLQSFEFTPSSTTGSTSDASCMQDFLSILKAVSGAATAFAPLF
jgi:hypothetical protein